MQVNGLEINEKRLQEEFLRIRMAGFSDHFTPLGRLVLHTKEAANLANRPYNSEYIAANWILANSYLGICAEQRLYGADATLKINVPKNEQKIKDEELKILAELRRNNRSWDHNILIASIDKVFAG